MRFKGTTHQSGVMINQDWNWQRLLHKQHLPEGVAPSPGFQGGSYPDRAQGLLERTGVLWAPLLLLKWGYTKTKPQKGDRWEGGVGKGFLPIIF